MTTQNNERVDPMKKVLLFLAVLAAGIASAAELELVKAFYGSKDLVADVTETVRKNAIAIPGVLLAMPVDNRLLGGDPAPQAYKQLTVIYRENDKEKKAVAGETQTCIVLAEDFRPTEAFRMIGAYYGFADQWNNVTEKLRTAPVDVQVDNFNFGPDPAPSKPKSLIVIYCWKNKVRLLHLAEREIFFRDFYRKNN